MENKKYKITIVEDNSLDSLFTSKNKKDMEDFIKRVVSERNHILTIAYQDDEIIGIDLILGKPFIRIVEEIQ